MLIAPDRYAGTLTAAEAASAIADGWSRSAPRDEVVLLPLSDGSAGFLDVLAAAAPGAGPQVLAVTVSDPWCDPVPATILVTETPGIHGDLGSPGGGGTTAYLEASQVLAPHGRRPRDPAHTTSRGVGELVAAALETGARRILLGVGPVGEVATHDAGSGLLAALGVGGPGVLDAGGMRLADLQARDLDGLSDLRARLRGVDLVLVTRDDLPLLGFQGASAVEAELKGASPGEGQLLEAAFGHWADLVTRVLPPATDLLTGRPIRLERQPGAGVAGGLGHAVLALGGRVVDGAAFVAGRLGLDAAASRSHLLVTGEGSAGWRSLRRSVLTEVSGAGLRHGVPTVLVAGQVQIGRRDWMSAGLSGAYAVADRPERLADALADPAGTLAERAARVARTWSPGTTYS